MKHRAIFYWSILLLVASKAAAAAAAAADDVITDSASREQGMSKTSGVFPPVVWTGIEGTLSQEKANSFNTSHQLKECLDVLPECPDYADQGFCSNPEIMAKCKYSCDGCYNINDEGLNDVTSPLGNANVDWELNNGSSLMHEGNITALDEELGVLRHESFENNTDLTFTQEGAGAVMPGTLTNDSAATDDADPLALDEQLRTLIHESFKNTPGIITPQNRHDQKQEIQLKQKLNVPNTTNMTATTATEASVKTKTKKKTHDTTIDEDYLDENDLFEFGENGVGAVGNPMAAGLLVLFVTLKILTDALELKDIFLYI